MIGNIICNIYVTRSMDFPLCLRPLRTGLHHHRGGRSQGGAGRAVLADPKAAPSDVVVVSGKGFIP